MHAADDAAPGALGVVGLYARLCCTAAAALPMPLSDQQVRASCHASRQQEHLSARQSNRWWCTHMPVTPTVANRAAAHQGTSDA